jgi:hypothetical protein
VDIVLCNIGSMITFAAGIAGDDALLPLCPFKFAPEVSPSLIDWSTALSLSTGIRDGASVENE